MKEAKHLKDKEVFKKKRIPDVIESTSKNEIDLVSKPSKVKDFGHNKPSTSTSRRSSRHHSEKHSHSRSRHAHESKPREHKKFKRRKEKLKVSCDQKLQMHYETAAGEKAEERKSIITKNRLTQAVGIYNKGKTSDTIYREQCRSKFFSKRSENLKQKTEQDMSKVLDCSSFQIEPLNVGATEMLDESAQDNQSGTCSPHSESQTHFSVSPLKTDEHASAGSFAGTGSGNNGSGNIHVSPKKFLPLETPLRDITQTLMNFLNPVEISERDYLGEIRSELKSYFRKSSSMLQQNDSDTETKEKQPATPNSYITPVRIGSKNHPGRKLFTSSIGKIEYMARRSARVRFFGDSPMDVTEPMDMDNNQNDNRQERLPIATSDPQILDQAELTTSLLEHLPTDYESSSQSRNNDNHTPFDILSILDHDLKCTDEIDVFDVESPKKYGEISPLKKPSLEIPTPPGKLLPRKLF